MGASVAAIIIAKERRITELFQAAGATSPGRSRSTIEMGIQESVGFRLLRRHGVLLEAHPGFFYLDADAWEAMRLRRIRAAAVAIGIVILFGLVLAWTTLKAM